MEVISDTQSSAQPTSEGCFDGNDSDDVQEVYNEDKMEASTQQANFHPLLNDLVVSQIMKMMSKLELLKCRQVCTLWNERVVPLLQKQITIEFGCYRTDLTINVEQLNAFAYLMTGCRNGLIPFRNFSLIGLNIQKDGDLFFRICGPTLKQLHLKLTDTKNVKLSHLKELFWNKLPSLETLLIHSLGSSLLSQKIFPNSPQADIPKLLNLKSIGLYQNQDSKIYSAFYSDLFSAAINLSEIQIMENVNSSDVLFYCRVTASALVALQSQHVNLKKIQVMEFFSLSEGHVQLLISLSRMGLALAKLKVYHLIGDLKTETFYEFLTSQKDTLQQITLGGLKKKRDLPPMNIVFPKGMNIKILKLTGIWGSDPVSCQPINYAASTPRLERLRIGGSLSSKKLDCYFPQQNNNMKFPCIKLKSLNLPHSINYSMFPERVAKIFPNVKKLKLHNPNSEFLTEIFKAWPQLEEMTIMTAYGRSNLDAGFTGISHEDLLQIEKKGAYAEGILERYKTTASICDLKNLKRLTCIVRNVGTVHERRIPNIITDLSAYFALRHMKQLRYLTITGYHVIHSDTVVDTLEITKHQRQLICKSLENAFVYFGPEESDINFDADESPEDPDLSDSDW